MVNHTDTGSSTQDARLSRKRTLLYLVLAFGIAWTWAFAVVWPMISRAESIGATTQTQLAVMGCMFAPALAMAITRLVTREGFRDAWLKPREFGRTWKYYALGWLGPLALTVVGTVIWFLVNPSDFDPEMTSAVDSVRAQLAAAGQADTISEEQIRAVLPLQLVMTLVAPVLNFIPCLGEEWGWRGYLLPKLLERHSMGTTLVLGGVIWGVWHAPLTMLGHNYGTGYPGFPLTGILAMCVFCTVLGVFLSYVTLRSGSCLPAILAHGMVNGCGSIGVLFSASGGNPFLGPVPTGVIGGVGFIVVAVAMAVALVRSASHKEYAGA